MAVRFAAVLVPALASLVFAAPAGAVIPTGNLLVNPGAEEGTAAPDEHSAPAPPGWTIQAGTPTFVLYGAPAFPTKADSAALGGGRSFFAGGPGAESVSTLRQDRLVGAAQPDIEGGSVQVTFGGCLGGYLTDTDYLSLQLRTYDEVGAWTDTWTLFGPNRLERGSATKLMPRSRTAAVPKSTRRVSLWVHFSRENGAYNDAYADNLLLALSPIGTAAPQPSCSVPGGPKPGPGGDGGGGAAGSNPAVPLQRASSRARLSKGRLLVRLKCMAKAEDRCKGKLALSVARLPKLVRKSAVGLGSARFDIPGGKTRTVRVKLKRRARTRLAGLSRRRLGRVKVNATATVGGRKTKFKLRLKR